MIRNPGGAAEKTYKITTTNWGISVKESAAPGEYVVVGAETSTIIVKGVSGMKIPYSNTLNLTRASGVSYFFVMPAEDVTIS